jgi:hypothetical protein
MHVVHPDRFLLYGSGAAHAFPQRDADAGRKSLKGAEDQLIPVQQVKSDPVDVSQHVVEEGSGIRQIGNAVRLAFDQTGELLQQQFVSFVLGTRVFYRLEHPIHPLF